MIKLQQAAYFEPPDIHMYDADPIVIHARLGRLASDLVLFVHGLTGNRYGYWGKIPRFVLEDVPAADVGLYFYKTVWKRFGFTRSISLEEEARVLANALRQVRLYRTVTIVGHSMGGLLAKAAIVDLLDRNDRKTLGRVGGLVLLACPQLGSLRVPRAFKWISRDGRALYPHNETILRIDTLFSSKLSTDQAADPMDKYSIPTWAILAAEDFWVDALSAGIGIPDEQKHTVRGSHGSIINPSHKSADPYVFLRDCLDTSFGPIVAKADAEELNIEDARPEDVPSIRELAIRFFGEGVTPEEVLLQFAAEGGIFRVVKRVISTENDRRERFSGYFCVIPLSSEATSSILNEDIRGNDLTVKHLPLQPEATSAVYIGALAARDYYSRAVVLEALRLHIRYAITQGVRQVLTRPLTSDGLRIVKKYLFRPVRQEGIEHLYTLDATAHSVRILGAAKPNTEPHWSR